jgi:NAD-dependent deacetylase sirtuin 4
VVFFGGTVPADTVAAAHALVDHAHAQALLVVGSSLAVYSGYRFVRRASERGLGIGIVNLGPTRADALATVKLEARAGDALTRLASRLL